MNEEGEHRQGWDIAAVSDADYAARRGQQIVGESEEQAWESVGKRARCVVSWEE